MLNYFNYFTEIEDRFHQRRGALQLLSKLEAVLRGIRWTSHFLLCVSILLLYQALSFGQAAPQTPAGIVSAEVVAISPNPADKKDSIVSLKVDIRATGKPLAVNYAPFDSYFPDSPEKHFLLGAWLMRFNGKAWSSIMPNTPSMVGGDLVKTEIIKPGDHATYLLNLSMKDFGVRKNERLRVACRVWPNTENTGDFDAAIMLDTPAFNLPAN